jgi:hypothetical protein
MFGWTGALTADQLAKITAMKWLIYDGLQAALAAGVPQAKAGILVDVEVSALNPHTRGCVLGELG